MKGLFPQYADSTEKDYRKTWGHALFVFDTNVLLNLYRYHTSARDELIQVLGQLSQRIWIPHHVALEFQRNRLKVIGELAKRFSEISRAVESSRTNFLSDLDNLRLNKRHAVINPAPLASGLRRLVEDFLTELNGVREAQQKLTAPDPLKARIEEIFEGKVGPAPPQQSSIDELYAEAERRFRLKIPPGYRDAEKDKDTPDEYVQGGITYKRKYGDFIIWKQILAHAKTAQVNAVIMVIDDAKDDWWLTINADGPKTIGPRPELIEEAAAEGSITSLLFYDSEGFLKYAKELLDAQVSDETLTEVRDLSRALRPRQLRGRRPRQLGFRAERSVLRWIRRRFPTVRGNPSGFPSFLAERDGGTFGFHIRIYPDVDPLSDVQLIDDIAHARDVLAEGHFAELTVVLIATTDDDFLALYRRLHHLLQEDIADLQIVIGIFKENDGFGRFVPLIEGPYNALRTYTIRSDDEPDGRM